MRYVAVEHLKWGDSYIAPDEPVPSDDEHRDYASMLRAGQIREVADVVGDPADDVQVPDGVVPGETPGWPVGTFVIPLSDEQRAELADAGISGTLTAEDLAGLLTPASEQEGEDPPSDTGEALPEGVTALGGGWFKLPGDAGKVHGRQALTEALAGK